MFPDASWEDSIGINVITKEKVRLKDESQFYKLIFEQVICVDSLINDLKGLPNIVSAERPFLAFTTYTPNDYSESEQWALHRIEATKAWDITYGSDQIKIAISDIFNNTNINYLHNELKSGKIVYNPSNFCQGHGQLVAGCAGALTNNGSIDGVPSIASIGFNVSLMFTSATSNGIRTARNNGAHIINCSWITGYYTDLDTVIYNTLNRGIIVTAAVGNNQANVQPIGTIPVVTYPAAYNYSDIGKQVIAVTATHLDSGSEVFGYPPDGRWNYSPGNDPVNYPTSSFVDITGPGVLVKVLHWTLTNDYQTASGTSLSAPLVAGVLGLIRSIFPALTPEIAYTILRNTAEKVGADSYNANGWNQYMGYGRVNAYKALKYTLEHYGGTLTQSLTIPLGETWNIQPGVTINFANGTSLIVNGTLNAVGSSSNKITFTSSSGTWNGIRFNSGSSGSVQYCNINNATIGIQCNSSSPTIQYNNLNNITNIGIYLYNTSPSLLRNTIQGSSGSYGYNGIRCEEYSSPYIAKNTIRYFTTGINNYRYSSPNFSENAFSEGHNKIVRTSTAIYGWYYSSPMVGQNGYPWGYNYIDSASTYNVEAAWYTNIMAENNWWGTSSPPANKFNAVSNSSIDYTPYLASPPSLSIREPDTYTSTAMPIALKIASGTASAVSSDLSSNSLFDDEDIKTALQYEIKQEYQSAFDIYEKVFKKELSTSKGKYALVRLGDCFFKLNRNGIDKYLAGISESYKSLKKDEISVIALDLINRELLTNREYEKVADNMRKIKNEFNINSEIEKSALYGLISLHVNCLGDTKSASIYYEELKQKFPKDELLNDCEILLGNQYDASLNEKMVNDNESTKHEEFVLTTSNYPNPFNPTTTISYALPEDGKVSIKIIDILGREVITLYDGYNTSGKHSVIWNARDVSSGIYFYSINFNNQKLYKKILLMK